MKRNWVPILICLSLLAVPAVLRAEPAAPAVVVNPMAGAIPLAWVCCTPEDKAACKVECAPCSPFTHCFAAECLCNCLC